MRHCVTWQMVAGSIPDGVIEIFHLLNLLAPELFFFLNFSTPVYKM